MPRGLPWRLPCSPSSLPRPLPRQQLRRWLQLQWWWMLRRRRICRSCREASSGPGPGPRKVTWSRPLWTRQPARITCSPVSDVRVCEKTGRSGFFGGPIFLFCAAEECAFQDASRRKETPRAPACAARNKRREPAAGLFSFCRSDAAQNTSWLSFRSVADESRHSPCF